MDSRLRKMDEMRESCLKVKQRGMNNGGKSYEGIHECDFKRLYVSVIIALRVTFCTKIFGKRSKICKSYYREES